MKRKSLLTSAIVCAAVSFTFGIATVQLQASAQGTQPTYTSVADLDFKMVDGAWIREASTLEEAGIRFKMTMPVEEYAWLMENTGEDKKYEEVTFGMFIAPNYYHGLKNLNDQANVLGDSRVYGWLKDGETVWTESADYTANNSLVQILNTEGDMSADKKNGALYSYYGSAIGMKEANLTTEYIGVGYIRYTQGGVTSYEFATTADNARSITYLTQCAVDSGALDSSKTAHQDMIDEYIGKVANKSVEYTVEYYAVGAAENAEPLLTEKQTANINTKITIDPVVASKKVAGYVFNERSNPDLYNLATNPIEDRISDQTQDTAIQKTVYANDKTLLKVYLDDGNLYDFENMTEAEFVKHIKPAYTGNETGSVVIAESGATGKALQLTSTADTQYVGFDCWDLTKLQRAMDAGYTTLKMDVYYQYVGEGDQPTATGWVTAFGNLTSIKAGEWKTLAYTLKKDSSATYPSAIYFNISNKKNYTIYVDNIRLTTETAGFVGYEDTLTNQASKYFYAVSNTPNGMQAVETASTECVYSGDTSVKISLAVSNQANTSLDLNDGNGNAINGAWIKANAGKQLSFWIYYKNDSAKTETMWLTVSNQGGDGRMTGVSQGAWKQITLDLDSLAYNDGATEWWAIRLNFNTNNFATGTIYIDHMEVVEK